MKLKLISSFAAIISAFSMSTYAVKLSDYPTRGWSSADSYDGAPNEEQVNTVMNAMKNQGLLRAGYNYIVLDGFWWAGSNSQSKLRKSSNDFSIDAWGRYIPSVSMYPSAKDGRGLKALADKLHAAGFKLGIWIPRGIPAIAVEKKSPILGTSYTADQIVDHSQDCTWLSITYGINPSHPAAQAYYQSIADLYASWGVDFVKADCFYGEPEYPGEITLIAEAMKKADAKYPMILSFSPGNDAKLSQAEWALKNGVAGNMYRITGDMWDRWKHVVRAFNAAAVFYPLIDKVSADKTHIFPDLDILAVGYGFLDLDPPGPMHWSSLTTDEQTTMMNLWSIFRSPLFLGSFLPTNDFTKNLLTNEEVLAVQRYSSHNRLIANNDNGTVIWAATPTHLLNAYDSYVGVFNISDLPNALPVTVNFTDLGFAKDDARYVVRDLWSHQTVAVTEHSYTVMLKPHQSQLLRITRIK